MNSNQSPKNILIAPLNWGLGHATRCIPIIRALQENNYIPIIASDGIALDLLRKEFPYIKALALPSYQIEYAKNGKHFKWKLLKSLPKMIRAIVREKKMVQQWIVDHDIDAIISDNRLGVISKKVPSVFITHQLNVMTGNTTWLTSKMHQYIINKFNSCWIPDFEGTPNLAGELSHCKRKKLNLKYIGPLSRMHKKEVTIAYDLMIILSGPEPQRTLLEERLKTELDTYSQNVIFIRGIIEKEQKKKQLGKITYYNYMNSKQLEQAFNESALVLCRSGYTTIMDLAQLEKKAFFIPTPGQYEQLYLAEKLQKEGIAPFSLQEEFKISDLNRTVNYKTITSQKTSINWKELFELFE
ncbi:glycosyltransferase [Flavobacterium sp.]|uniref:glycosyltransferase n=1 Tax=Flavobacterium sp. TaxID=239 RepID=UPI00261A7003|nr:glycosyltransferase [Flavobacterium sp.]MDG2431411.1 glycosyltransferase [Flavobacterium sp.]